MCSFLIVRDFHGSQARNRHIWTWRSCFCYKIQWKASHFIGTLKFQNPKTNRKIPKNPIRTLFSTVEKLPTGLPDLSKPSRTTISLRKIKFFRNKCLKKFDTWEICSITTTLPQHLTQGGSRHAEVESEVKS